MYKSTTYTPKQNITKYHSVESANLVLFDKEVNKYLSNGWELHGYREIITNPAITNTIIYNQVLIQ